MATLSLLDPQEVIHNLILSEDYFPNNSQYPLLIYKQIFKCNSQSSELIKNHLSQNSWISAWVDGIYDYS